MRRLLWCTDYVGANGAVFCIHVRVASAFDVTMSVITAQEQGPDGAARGSYPQRSLHIRTSVVMSLSLYVSLSSAAHGGSQWVSSKRGFTVAGSHMPALDMLGCSALTRHSAQPLVSARHRL